MVDSATPAPPSRVGSTLLRPDRALDLTTELGELAGRILADLGVDVVKIEPPAGDPARWRAPFRAPTADPEGSLPWWASNLNKRSLALDLDAEPDRELFRQLGATADFVLESFPPG